MDVATACGDEEVTKRGAQRARGRRKAERRANRWTRVLATVAAGLKMVVTGPMLIDAIPRLPSFAMGVDLSNGPDHTAHITLRRPG